jgi:Fe-S-cluster containining protein
VVAAGKLVAVNMVFPTLPGVACKKGCNKCCSLNINISLFEVLRIATCIRQSSKKSLPELIERLEKTGEEIAKLSVRDRFKAGIYCPLLKNGNCSIYEFRPMMCKSYNSRSAEQCESGGEIESYMLPLDLATAFQGTLQMVEAKMSGRIRLLEFVSALAVALKYPDSISRWDRFDSVCLSEERTEDMLAIAKLNAASKQEQLIQLKRSKNEV